MSITNSVWVRECGCDPVKFKLDKHAITVMIQPVGSNLLIPPAGPDYPAHCGSKERTVKKTAAILCAILVEHERNSNKVKWRRNQQKSKPEASCADQVPR